MCAVSCDWQRRLHRQVVAMTRLFFWSSHFICFIFAFRGINALVKLIIVLRRESFRSHLSDLQAIEFVCVGDVPNTTSCMCSTHDQVAHQQHALQPLL
jgi:hypothetical protein